MYADRLFGFFFPSRRRHTRYWRDWSSDVCSSDLTSATSVVPAVFEGLAPYDPAVEDTLFGSTDVADVSWITPTVQAWVACYAFGTPLHSWQRSEEHTSELQSRQYLVCRLLLEKKKKCSIINARATRWSSGIAS